MNTHTQTYAAVPTAEQVLAAFEEAPSTSRIVEEARKLASTLKKGDHGMRAGAIMLWALSEARDLVEGKATQHSVVGALYERLGPKLEDRLTDIVIDFGHEIRFHFSDFIDRSDASKDDATLQWRSDQWLDGGADLWRRLGADTIVARMNGEEGAQLRVWARDFATRLVARVEQVVADAPPDDFALDDFERNLTAGMDMLLRDVPARLAAKG
jgi:hypothetical protein